MRFFMFILAFGVVLHATCNEAVSPLGSTIRLIGFISALLIIFGAFFSNDGDS